MVGNPNADNTPAPILGDRARTPGSDVLFLRRGIAKGAHGPVFLQQLDGAEFAHGGIPGAEFLSARSGRQAARVRSGRRCRRSALKTGLHSRTRITSWGTRWRTRSMRTLVPSPSCCRWHRRAWPRSMARVSPAGAPNPNLPNGITVFPGGFPLYRNGQLIGAVGISGDGVDQDDIVGASAIGDGPSIRPDKIRADQFTYDGARLPYAKFPRNPER